MTPTSFVLPTRSIYLIRISLPVRGRQRCLEHSCRCRVRSNTPKVHRRTSSHHFPPTRRLLFCQHSQTNVLPGHSGGQPSDTGSISTLESVFMVEHASMDKDTGIVKHSGY